MKEITEIMEKVKNINQRARYIAAVTDDLTNELLALQDKVKALEDENYIMNIREMEQGRF